MLCRLKGMMGKKKKNAHKSVLISTSQTPQDASVKSQLSLNVTAWLHWKTAAGRIGSNKAKTDGGQEERKVSKTKETPVNGEKMAREELRSSGERGGRGGGFLGPPLSCQLGLQVGDDGGSTGESFTKKPPRAKE